MSKIIVDSAPRAAVGVYRRVGWVSFPDDDDAPPVITMRLAEDGSYVAPWVEVEAETAREERT